MNDPVAGCLLVANPHLNDPNFIRGVIFLCEHNDEGSFGFVLNRKTDFIISDLVPELADLNIPVYEGGPVELNTLHFIHQYPQEVPGGKEVYPGVYWGGSFHELIANISSRNIDINKVRFFLGYSGWDTGQLDAEMDEKTWIIAKAATRFLFELNSEVLWRSVLKNLGGEYEWIINAPINPRLN